MLREYLPTQLFIVAALLFALGSIFLSALAGPRRSIAVKGEPYECGIPAVGMARNRFPVKFYLVAMLFIILDIEIIFLHPWAVIYRELGWFGFFERRWPHYNWGFCRQGRGIWRSGPSEVLWG